MATFENRLAGFSSPVLSIFRIIFGLLFTLHGTMKVFGWPLGTALEVGSWPGWWAGIIELVTGLLILVGLFTRIAAFIASGHMAVAYIWQHWPNGFWPYDAGMGGNGGEPALMYCFAFLLLAALGGGSLSLDARRRGGVVGGGARGQRVVSGTAAPGGGVVTGRGAAPRGGLLSRFRRNRY